MKGVHPLPLHLSRYSQCSAMAGKGNYHIDWDDFMTTSSERFRALVGKKEFSDVTLVSSDGKRIPGHIGIWVICTFFNKKSLEWRGIQQSSDLLQRNRVHCSSVSPQFSLQDLKREGRRWPRTKLASSWLLLRNWGLRGLQNGI